MNDTTLNKLAKEINIINKQNGWNVIKNDEWDDLDYKIPAILALIHSEVSEALEAYRKNDKENFFEELSDIIIRVLDCAGGMQRDIHNDVLSKLEKNRNRSYRHGGKKI